jgi:hypothetical protein
MAKNRRCLICNKLRDPITGDCPTPADCDKLRSPAQRMKREAAATARRAAAARVESEHLGVAHLRGVSVPGDERRHADAVRRAVTGWKRPRRSSRVVA